MLHQRTVSGLMPILPALPRESKTMIRENLRRASLTSTGKIMDTSPEGPAQLGFGTFLAENGPGCISSQEYVLQIVKANLQLKDHLLGYQHAEFLFSKLLRSGLSSYLRLFPEPEPTDREFRKTLEIRQVFDELVRMGAGRIDFIGTRVEHSNGTIRFPSLAICDPQLKFEWSRSGHGFANRTYIATG
jgi:hypothetical protein